jgi:hypothetical protein
MAVSALTEAIVKSTEVQNDAKDEIIELLGALTKDAGKSKDQRQPAMAKALLARVGELVKLAPGLAQLWQVARSLFDVAFG